MSLVPTLNIRNVPAEVVAALKRRARRNARSLNAEVVDALRESVTDERHRRSVRERLYELREDGPLLPDSAPKPEDVIREARDERAREIERRAGRS